MLQVLGVLAVNSWLGKLSKKILEQKNKKITVFPNNHAKIVVCTTKSGKIAGE
jgi:hypothetical protein